MRPVLFAIGPYDFFAAPVFAGLSALLASIYIWRARAHAELSSDDYWTLMAILAAGTIAGGLAHYFLLYGGGLMKNLAWTLKQRDVRGGAYYGTLWGGLLGCIAYAKLKKASLPRLADLFGGASILALALMRLGCIQHGCCYGHPTTLPWAVIFTDARSALPKHLLGAALHPVQLYESLGCILVFLFVHFVVMARIKKGKAAPGSAFLFSVGLYSAFRFFIEFIRATDRGILRTHMFSTTQVLTVLSLAAVALLYRRWSRTSS